MPPEATLPPSDVNVPGDYFSLAGFEVTTYGRFWVTPEDVLKQFVNEIERRGIWFLKELSIIARYIITH
jgi:hypothetical protein